MTQELKARRSLTVEDVEAKIRKLNEKKKVMQHSRWLELGKLTESTSKKGQQDFDASAFFTAVYQVMKGEVK